MSSTDVFDGGWFRPAWPGATTAAWRGHAHHLLRELHHGDEPVQMHAEEAAEHHGPEHHGHGRGGRRFGGPEFRFGGGPFGFGGPFGPGRGPRGGRRARRGDVRGAALLLLAEEPRNGYQIIQELANRSDGAWRASPGSIYPALQQLEDEGLIRATSDDGRRQWELTDAGRTYVEENRESLGTPWESVGGGVPDGVRDLADIGLQVGSAVHQVVRAGNDAQIARAVKILTDTRRALYRVLAEDDESAG